MSTAALRSNLWKMKWNTVCRHAISFGIPVIVLFWQSNGLSLTEVMLLQSIFSVVMVILEIPSGYFADIFGRKRAMILGSLLMFLGVLTISLSGQFWTFLLAEILLSTGLAFTSGADSSMVYDTLNELGEKTSFKKVWGSIICFMLIGMFFMNFIGGFAADFNLRYAFYLALPFTFSSFLLAFLLHEPTRHKRIIKSGYLKELLVVIKKEVYHHKNLRYTMLFSAFLFTLFHISLWLYNPYFEAANIDLVYFGGIFAVFNVVAALSSKYSHQIEEKIGKKGSYILMFGLLGLSHSLLGSFITFFSFLFAFGHQWIRGFYQVVINDYIHDLTTSDIRATVVSVNNMVARLFYALTLPFLGWYADVYSAPQAFALLGAVTFAIGIFLYFPLRRLKVI